MSQSIVLRCPAKVNLALSVGAARDDGYHPIASWMVALDFGDDLGLTVEVASEYDIAFADDAPVTQAIDWPLEKDLAYRAHRLLEERCGRSLATSVRLRKRVPAGGGLGGGSADAAGMLVGLNRLHGLGLERDELIRLGAGLGCDVAFAVAAMTGTPSVIATGLGDVLEAAPLAEPVRLVLIVPPFGCPTGPVYRAFDAAPAAEQPDETAIRALTQRRLEPSAAGLFNDLARPAMKVEPRLSEAVEVLTATLGRPVHVTGSGSTLFVLVTDDNDAAAMVRRIEADPGLAAAAAKTITSEAGDA